MRTSTSIFIGLVGVALGLALPGVCSAQAWVNSEIERGLHPGAYVPYDAAPYSEVYGYGFPQIFYPQYNGERLVYLDYLDKLDRAHKSGGCRTAAKCDIDQRIEEIDRDYYMNSYGRYGTGWHLFHR